MSAKIVSFQSYYVTCNDVLIFIMKPLKLCIPQPKFGIVLR